MPIFGTCGMIHCFLRLSAVNNERMQSSIVSRSYWSAPQEILSNFGGDPVLDDAGNIYFTHHFFSDSLTMIEADIYVARRR